MWGRLGRGARTVTVACFVKNFVALARELQGCVRVRGALVGTFPDCRLCIYLGNAPAEVIEALDDIPGIVLQTLSATWIHGNWAIIGRASLGSKAFLHMSANATCVRHQSAGICKLCGN
jgi:hypothetical protein